MTLPSILALLGLESFEKKGVTLPSILALLGLESFKKGRDPPFNFSFAWFRKFKKGRDPPSILGLFDLESLKRT